MDHLHPLMSSSRHAWSPGTMGGTFMLIMCFSRDQWGKDTEYRVNTSDRKGRRITLPVLLVKSVKDWACCCNKPEGQEPHVSRVHFHVHIHEHRSLTEEAVLRTRPCTCTYAPRSAQACPPLNLVPDGLFKPDNCLISLLDGLQLIPCDPGSQKLARPCY